MSCFLTFFTLAIHAAPSETLSLGLCESFQLIVLGKWEDLACFCDQACRVSPSPSFDALFWGCPFCVIARWKEHSRCFAVVVCLVYLFWEKPTHCCFALQDFGIDVSVSVCCGEQQRPPREKADLICTCLFDRVVCGTFLRTATDVHLCSWIIKNRICTKKLSINQCEIRSVLSFCGVEHNCIIRKCSCWVLLDLWILKEHFPFVEIQWVTEVCSVLLLLQMKSISTLLLRRLDPTVVQLKPMSHSQPLMKGGSNELIMERPWLGVSSLKRIADLSTFVTPTREVEGNTRCSGCQSDISKRPTNSSSRISWQVKTCRY